MLSVSPIELLNGKFNPQIHLCSHGNPNHLEFRVIEKLLSGVCKVAQWVKAIYRQLENRNLSLECTVEGEN